MKEENELTKHLFTLVIALLAGIAVPFVVKLYTSDIVSFMQSLGSGTWIGIALLAGWIGGSIGRYFTKLTWSFDPTGPAVFCLLEGILGVVGLFAGISLIT